jgi:hypothetical protein
MKAHGHSGRLKHGVVRDDTQRIPSRPVEGAHVETVRG